MSGVGASARPRKTHRCPRTGPLKEKARVDKRLVQFVTVSGEGQSTCLRARQDAGEDRQCLLLALHTWGSALPIHLHLHGLVTAGGVGPEGRWVATRPDFLIWGPILRDVFRQKLLAGLRRLLDQDSLYLPPTLAVAEVRARLAQLQHVPWHVRIEPPYASGKGLVVYLARYLHGGPLKNHRLVAFTGTAVCLRYRERRGRPHPKWRTLTLPVEEFLDRLFQHVPVPGLQMVRASGLYGRHQRAALQHCGLRLQPGWQEPPPAPAADQRCPRCGAALVVWSRARRARRARGLKNPWGPDRPSSACPTERWSRRRAVAYSHAP